MTEEVEQNVTTHSDGIARESCPHCNGPTDFVQFATGEESTTETSAEEVGDGFLELRVCDACGAAIENIHTIAAQRSVQSP